MNKWQYFKGGTGKYNTCIYICRVINVVLLLVGRGGGGEKTIILFKQI